MTRKALARRIAEVLFNEPATRRGAGAAQPEGLRDLAGALLLVGQRPHGYSPSRAAHPPKIRSSAAIRASDLVH